MSSTFFERFIEIWPHRDSFWHSFLVVLDIFVVALIFYWLYLLIKETKAWRISLGLVFILIVMLFAKFLGLVMLNWIFRHFLTVLVVAIPIVFQPELRSMLEKLGRIKLSDFPQKKKDSGNLINAIVDAASLMAENRIGALIVIQKKTGLKDYIEMGTILDAEVSAPLLVTIFSKNSPLHDGAVIIVGHKIKSASCLLPMAETRLKQGFGARHQAALGLSRETDALIIVVSEERGEISFVREGKINSKLSPFDLKHLLSKELEG